MSPTPGQQTPTPPERQADVRRETDPRRRSDCGPRDKLVADPIARLSAALRRRGQLRTLCLCCAEAGKMLSVDG